MELYKSHPLVSFPSLLSLLILLHHPFPVVSLKSVTCWNICAFGMMLCCVSPALPSSGQEEDSGTYFPSETEDKWTSCDLLLENSLSRILFHINTKLCCF